MQRGAGPRKRRRDDGGDHEGDAGPSTSTPRAERTVGQMTSHIRNKQRREEAYAKLKAKQNKAKKVDRKKRQEEAARAEQLGLEPPKRIARTIENTREKDETMVDPTDAEVAEDAAQDEFADHFARQRTPMVLLTTCFKPTKASHDFMADLLKLLPHAQYYLRKGYPLKKIVQYASARGFSDMLVVHEDRKVVNGVVLIHLPGGPTAHFRLTNLKLNKQIKGHGRISSHKPELVLNNFDTMLGQRVGRMLASLFDQDPQFKGRRVATFHNQRDFIFFRHHRYIFEEKEKREKGKKEKRKTVIARLQELGPRFTLKLLSLQKGTFDTKYGEYEWIRKSDQDTRTSRRKFNL